MVLSDSGEARSEDDAAGEVFWVLLEMGIYVCF